MPRDLTPIEQRPTLYLQQKFDRLTRNALVADAIEAFCIMQELGRRQMIAEAMAQQANQNSDMAPPGSVLIELPGPGNGGLVDTPNLSPQPAAGDNADAAAGEAKEATDGAAG